MLVLVFLLELVKSDLIWWHDTNAIGGHGEKYEPDSNKIDFDFKLTWVDRLVGKIYYVSILSKYKLFSKSTQNRLLY